MLIEAALIGLFATAIMDLGGVIGTKLGVLHKPSTAMLGRWSFELLKGRFSQKPRDIRSAQPRAHESTLGLIAHYLIGAVLSIAFFSMAAQGLVNVTLVSSIVYGLLTNIFPWLFMFPSMGFGLFARRAPPEARLFRTSLINHFIYGLGLWVGSFIS